MVPRLDPHAPIEELTRTICDIESVSGNESTLADEIQAALAKCAHLEITRDADAIVARTNLGRDLRVVIAGHIDTVPVNHNLPVRLEEGTLIGRGTVDMKGGVAIQLKLAAELESPRFDVTWIWYDHEEVSAEQNGLGRLARNHPELLDGSFAVLCEPTAAEIEGGCNGTLRVEVRAKGVRAHSARAWVGKNAIHGLAPVLEMLSSYAPRTVEIDGLQYRESLSAVGVRGGVAGNVIPDEAVLEINYRFAPNESAKQAASRLTSLILDTGAEGIEVVVTDEADGARPGLDAPLAKAFVDAVGGKAKPKYGWTDVARFAALGIPAVNYGPGDPLLAHADLERVEIAQLRSCEQGLRKWLTIN